MIAAIALSTLLAQATPAPANTPYCWINTKTGKRVFVVPLVPNEPNGPPYYVMPSAGDPNSAFDPKTGVNYARVPCSEVASTAPQPTPAPPSNPVTPPSPTPAPIGMVAPKLLINHFDAFANFDSVRTNGFSGTGTGESFRLTSQWNAYNGGIARPLFTNQFTFERTNAQQSVLFGTLIIDENDDEDDCDDFFYYDWGPYNGPYGIGVGYSHYHPIYVYGTPYDMQGFGFSVSKFPNYSQPFSVYGGLTYSPSIFGNGANGVTGSYNVWKYDVGATVNPGWKIPVDFKIGYKWENWTGTGSTTGFSYRLNSPYLGASYQF